LSCPRNDTALVSVVTGAIVKITVSPCLRRHGERQAPGTQLHCYSVVIAKMSEAPLVWDDSPFSPLATEKGGV
jgi:hypothetical protein